MTSPRKRVTVRQGGFHTMLGLAAKLSGLLFLGPSAQREWGACRKLPREIQVESKRNCKVLWLRSRSGHADITKLRPPHGWTKSIYRGQGGSQGHSLPPDAWRMGLRWRSASSIKTFEHINEGGASSSDTT